MIIIAPPQVANVSTSQLRGVQHPLAAKFMEKMRPYGDDPVSIWTVINQLANSHAPENRDKLRFLRLRYWGAFRELQRVGLLCRHGSLIARKQFALMPSKKLPFGMSHPVRGKRTKNGGSYAKTSKTKPSPPSVPTRPILTQQSATQSFKEKSIIPPETEKTESVPRMPSDVEISAAGRALQLLPRRRRIYIGRLRGVRIRRLTPIVLPDGRVLPAYFIRRGNIYALLPDGPEYEGRFFERFRLEQLKIHRSMEAALLGSLKRGKKEMPSVAKQRTARRNGCQPARAGRRRGRPRMLR
jgi:hypothetical protein